MLATTGCLQESYAGGLTEQWTYSVERDADGMTVSSEGEVVVFGTQWVENSDVSLPWISRVNAAGEERWTRWYSAVTEILDVRVTAHGELYVASEPKWQILGQQTTCSALARLRANGAPEWSRDYDSTAEGCFHGVLEMQEFPGGGVALVDGHGAWLRYAADGAAEARIPAALPQNGLWDRGGAVLRGDGSRVIVMADDQGRSEVVFLSPEGEVLQTVPTTGSIIRAIAERSDGSLVLAGAVEQPGEGVLERDRWIGSLDAEGSLQWEQWFRGEGGFRRSEITDIAIAPGDYTIAVGVEDRGEPPSPTGDGWIGVFSPDGALAWEAFPQRLHPQTGELVTAVPRWVALDDAGAVFIGGGSGWAWVSRYEVGA